MCLTLHQGNAHYSATTWAVNDTLTEALSSKEDTINRREALWIGNGLYSPSQIDDVVVDKTISRPRPQNVVQFLSYTLRNKDIKDRLYLPASLLAITKVDSQKLCCLFSLLTILFLLSIYNPFPNNKFSFPKCPL